MRSATVSSPLSTNLPPLLTRMMVVLLAGLYFFIGAAANADEPFVDPYSVASASGEWVLRIVPSEPQGSGSAHYTMLSNGEVAWASEHEHTLREAVVSNAGMVVGYAYDNGYMGWGGNLVMLSISADGEVLHTESHKRDGPKLHVTPYPPGDPRGAGVLIDEAGQRAIVRITEREDSRSAPKWYIFNLTDGQRVGTQTPKPPVRSEWGFGIEFDARTTPAAGLIMVHWIVYENGHTMAVFELIDRDGAVVWSRRIEDEYKSRPEGWRWWDLVTDRVRQIEIGDEEFSIVSYAEGRTRYKLPDTVMGPFMGETNEEDAVPQSDPLPLSTPPPTVGQLESLGEVTLGAPVAAAVIDQIHQFAFDDRGRLAWVRDTHDPKIGPRLIIIDREGNTIADHPLNLPEVESSSRAQVVWLHHDRWAIARTVYAGHGGTHAQAWIIDAATGEHDAVPDFQSRQLRSISRTHDGGFIILSETTFNGTQRDHILRFTPEGTLAQNIIRSYLNIDDIAGLSDGRIAALNTAGWIELWTNEPDVQVPRSVPAMLGSNKGSSSGYYADLRADIDGGFVVYDSANNNLLHRFDKDGNHWQSLHARGPEGEPFRLYSAFAVDPDGHIWASDGVRLYRCGDDGRADRALGGPPPGAMANPVAITIDTDGNIYAVERGTAAVHVFDAQGNPARVMNPLPTDTPTQDALPWISVNAEGVVRYRMAYDSPIVSFAADGQRIGAETPPKPWHDDAERWRPVGQGWEHDLNILRRTNASGETITTIRHRPDGNWLVNVSRAAAAPDGSVAVLATRYTPGAMGGFHNEPHWLCLYTSEGEGRGTIALDGASGSRLSYDGERVMLIGNRTIKIFDTPLDHTTAPRLYHMPGNGKDSWAIIPRPDGTITTWQRGSRTIQHWRIPE